MASGEEDKMIANPEVRKLKGKIRNDFRTTMEIESKTRTNFTDKGDDDDSEDGWKEMGLCSKVKYVFRNISVEPLLALFQVSSVLSSLTTQNLNLQKACRVNLQLGEEVCYALENKNVTAFAEREVEVQQVVANMLIWQTVIQSSVPCILVIFIGSWSDRHKKRKPFMLIPLVGELLRNIGLLLCVYYFYELKVEVAGLVESIPTSLAGGVDVLYLAAFSYIGDRSSIKNRTARVGLMNMFFGAAWPIGAALSGILFQQLGFYGIYYISTTLYLLAFLYGSIRIKDRSKPQEENNFVQKSNNSCMHKITDFFNVKHIKDAIKLTFKRTSRSRWIRLYILFFTVIVVQGPMQGEYAVTYLYTRVRFNWNEVDYSMFSTYQFFINIIGVAFTTGVLSHLLKIDDAVIGMMASVSKVLSGIVFAFAPSKTVFYFGAIVDVLSGTSYIVVRSILSKIIPHAEIGQVSAVMTVVETMLPVVFKPMYSAIYKATVHTFPGAFYVIASIMFTPSVFLYWWMWKINKKEEKERFVIDETNLNAATHS